MSLVSFNPFATLLATVVTFALGALWYGALFNDAWLRLNGYGGKSEAELDEMKAEAPKAYGVSFICNGLMAAAMTVLADYMVLDTVAQALKLAVLVFCGFVDDARLPAYYNTCDVFAMPNREVADPEHGSLSVEGFGIVFLEAAACGKPVIAGRSGGAVYAVDDGTTGLLVDGDDVESLQQALLSLADEERRQRMGAAGIRFAVRFDWQRSADILRRYL
jgi:glycosyltransferase involved in cell wall biosynthesis